MSYAPEDQVKSLYNSLSETADDPARSLIYKEFATEFYLSYVPSAFNLERLGTFIANLVVLEYPDAPPCIAGTIEPSKDKTIYVLVFEKPADILAIGSIINQGMEEERLRTDTPSHAADYTIHATRNNEYQSVIASTKAGRGPNAPSV